MKVNLSTNTSLIAPYFRTLKMKKWTSPVSLCLALFALFCNAQEEFQVAALNDISTYEMDIHQSIISNTETSNRLSTLLSALRASDLDHVLGYDGQFTVFAPSNMAFEKLPPLTVAWLMNPLNKTKLKAVMSYHIIAGKLSASKILRAMCRGNGIATFTTVQGEKITATMNGIDIILTDIFGHNAKITLADSNHSNGVMHEIDSVFMPVKL
jgi:uncharacterized surface protein with fasciclin (FAS1) repeats